MSENNQQRNSLIKVETNINQLINSNAKVTDEILDNISTEWIIPKHISEKSIVVFYAESGTGKSLFSTELALYALKVSNKVKRIIYIDADNGATTVKKRQVTRFSKEAANIGKEFYYICTAVDNETNYNLHTVLENSLNINDPTSSQTIIIIDSLRHFFTGNMCKDEDVDLFFSILSALRKKYAGIWLLHHTGKNSARDNQIKKENSFKGNQAIKDHSDLVFEMQKISETPTQITMVYRGEKLRDDEEPFTILLNPQTHSIEIKTYKEYALNDRQLAWLELAEVVLFGGEKMNKEALKNAVKELAQEEYNAKQICGLNAADRLINELIKMRVFKAERLDGYQHNQVLISLNN